MVATFKHWLYSKRWIVWWCKTKNVDTDKWVHTGYGIDSICIQDFHLQMVALVKMSLFL